MSEDKDALNEAEDTDNEEYQESAQNENGGTKEAESADAGQTEIKDQTAENEKPDDEEASGKEDEKKEHLNHREKKAQKELEKKDEQIAELTDRLKRSMAEFDNYRKRTEKEKSGMYQMGAKDVIEKVLPVLDNFERGFSQVQEDDKEDPFTEGMQKVYKQFQTVLTDLGVTPIEAKGKPFDPNFHNAVMHIEDESVGENVVVDELQKGYMYNDTVVRHSMVKVAN